MLANYQEHTPSALNYQLQLGYHTSDWLHNARQDIITGQPQDLSSTSLNLANMQD